MNKLFFRQPTLVISFLTVLIMASTEAPIWISIFAVLIIGWKFLTEYYGFYTFPRKLTAALSFLLFIQVYIQYRSIFGQESSNTLLMGLSALKIMDYSEDRDHKFLVLLGFIMIAMKAIFSIDFYWLAPSGLAFVCLWHSMLETEFQKKHQFMTRLLVASLPLSLVLFVAFPRIVVPWAMSRSQPKGMVGFSDNLSPGDVAELASQDRLVFRVNFPGSTHVSSGLYWRGAVLTISEGLKWTSAPSRLRSAPKQRSLQGFRYTVILEPGSMGYLFTLNYPKRVYAEPLPVSELRHLVFRTVPNMNKPQTYEVLSDEDLKDRTPPTNELLSFPNLTGKTLDLVNDIKEKTKTDKEKLERLRQVFSDSSFVYTLKPGRYQHDDLDSFLFDRKRGFCEHFAGAYATLARAVGLPARVVIGYQGGEFNVFGDFWRVSQQDAHAWVEVFTNENWIRVDPTQWVAPLRLNLGAQGFFSLSESDQQVLARSSQWRNLVNSTRTSIWDAASFYIDDLNYQWTYFLLDFDSESQRGFWADLTKDFGVFIFASIALLVTSILSVRRLLSVRSKQTPMRRILDSVILWSERKGFAYDRKLSPLTNIQTLQNQFPDQREILGAVLSIYDLGVYQEKSVEKKTYARILRLVKELS